MFSKTLIFGLLSLSFVLGAPAALDADLLLKNAQDAQAANTAFKSLKATDDCTTGQTACIGTSSAECVADKWTITRCARGTQCFALPSVRSQGTIISCTSERNAQSVINAAGAPGDAAEASGKNGPPAAASSEKAQSASRTAVRSSATAAASPASGDRNADPVTVTVTVTPSPTLTPVVSTDLPSQTLTLPPDEASRLVASLTADGTFSVVTIAGPNGVANAAAATSAAAGPPSALKAPATVIKLTAAALPTQSSATTAALTPASVSSTSDDTSADDYGY
ncbi:hypothetical protein HGRIS_000297 [Hohenbuehelia grisea]|uniref:Carbohydrate-binding module family 19 domain-containing protein n=1 Tax=Hohenbuehelia grisea TaxID=104357 RepID=A0ABR3JQM1_9AGAR